MKSKYDYDMIKDYLHGLVDQERGDEIRKLIRQDEVARSIARGIVHLEQAFEGRAEDIDSYLENFRQKQLQIIQAKARRRQVFQMPLVRMAASFLLLLAAGTVVWMMFRPDLDSLLAAELQQPYPVSTIVRGPAGESARQKAFDLYTKGDYVQAAMAFNQAMGDLDDLASVTFYNGLSHLYAEDYVQAVKLLESNVVSESRYIEQARWYLGLALIKSENNPRAILTLGVIERDPRHFKHEQAVHLLAQLN